MSGGASVMTLLERDAYLDPGSAVNVTWGYPEGLTPQWIRDCQLQHATGDRDFLDVPPAEYIGKICGWFARFLGAGNVTLTPSCTMAFVIAAQALISRPGDEFVLFDISYDSYPRLLASLGARVRFARRDSAGLPDLDSARALVTGRTRAIVIVSPDNPLGVVCPRDLLRELMALCQQHDLTLLADHALAGATLAHVPLVPGLAGPGLSWIALGDTGKILGLNGSKFGALACPGRLRGRLEEAASNWFFQHAQYDLALVASVLTDPRFSLLGLASQVDANYRLLRQRLAPPLAVPPLRGGSFALVDAAGLGMDDVSYTQLLRDRYSTLVVPVSWFPAGQRPARQTMVRVCLARHPRTIARLADALNASAATAQRPVS